MVPSGPIAEIAVLRIVVATRPVDLRRGHDALAATAAGDLGLDIYSGVIVIFRSKRGDRLKMLAWDREEDRPDGASRLATRQAVRWTESAPRERLRGMARRAALARVSALVRSARRLTYIAVERPAGVPA